MPQIHLPQKKITLTASFGENLMSFLIKSKIPVASSCQGDGICGKCKMKVTIADTATSSKKLPAPSPLEVTTLERNKINEIFRLACQIRIEQDLIIEASYW